MLAELIEVIAVPAHDIDDEVSQVSEGDVGEHLDLAPDGRLDALECDAEGVLLHLLGWEVMGVRLLGVGRLLLGCLLWLNRILVPVGKDFGESLFCFLFDRRAAFA